MRTLNKKAGEKIFSLWWFVSISLVGAVIILMTMNYFDAPTDVRDIEISMLQEKIRDCLIKEGYLNKEINPEVDILEICFLNPNSITEKKTYLINITIYNSEKKSYTSWEYGRKSYKEDCEISGNFLAPHYPVCIKSKETAIYFNETENKKEMWVIELLIATNNQGYKKSFIPSGENKQ